ncbi:MAG TPA: RDD family protein [Verrucomicrobiae bacterium]
MKTNSLKRILALTPLLALAAGFTAPAQDSNTNATTGEKVARLIADELTNKLEIEVGTKETRIIGLKKHRRQLHTGVGEEVRIGSDFTLKEGEKAGDVVVIFGKAQIDGTVEGDLVNVLGGVTFGSNAVVKGDAVIVGGSMTISSTNTSLQGDLVVVGGKLDAPADFKPGGEIIHPPLGDLFEHLGWLKDWFKGALLWGRPIAPTVGWVWAVAGIIFLVHFLLNLLFDRPLRVCTATLDAKPLTAFLVGILVLLLFGPVCILLIASAIGIIVVPFLFCALLIAAVFGKIAVARWIGGNVVRRGTPEERFAPVRSFLIGALVIYLLYVIPIVGFATWALIRVIGLGAATLAFLQAFKKENPPTPTPAPATPTAPGFSAASNPGDAAAATPPLVVPVALVGIPPLDLATLPRGTFGIRLAAFLLDFMLVMVTCGILGLINHHGPGMFFSIFIAYRIALWTWRGTSIGGLVCNLRVVRVDGKPLRFADALVRGLSSIFSVMVFGLGFLWVIWDREKQAWHDKIAGTYVVRVPRSSPLL